MMELKKIPKVELHLHLDGSIRLEVLEDYYKRDLKSEVIAKDKCLNLADYLTKFDIPLEYLQTKDHLKKACNNLSKDLEEDGVIYAEVRFAPLKHTINLTLDEVIECVLEAFSSGNVKVNIILCMMRNDSYLDNLKVINLAEKYLGKGVVALDLAGDEKGYKTSSFESLFNILQEKKIPYTIHAGEIYDMDSMKSALKFKTKRLGHGIAAIKYPEILKKITAEKILLEVCPTSNVQTNIVDKYQNHPIKKLKEAGCIISINTDNRTVSNITLTEEYQKLIDNFGFTLADFIEFNINAINYSFLSEEDKIIKRKEIEKMKINL